jgi:DNA-binding MarR family transcriptional regulator
VSKPSIKVDSKNGNATRVHEFFVYWYEWLRSPGRRRTSEQLTGLPQSASMILHRLQYFGPVSVGELARAFGLDKSTISRQLEPLRQEGLIDETPYESNRRMSRISVSARGRKLSNRIASAQIEYWTAVLDHLSSTEQRQLAKLLGRLREAIEAQDLVLAETQEVAE